MFTRRNVFLIAIVLIAAILTGCATASVYDTSKDAGKLTVRYLHLTEYSASDIYPGDCAIYTSPEGLVMMVDCGNNVSFNEIIPVLEEMGIEKIDFFVMSHPHVDHIGSFTQIAACFPIGKVYKNYVEYTSDTYKGVMAYIENTGIECEVLYEGDSFMFGEYVRVDVYGPSRDQNVDVSNVAETNGSSIAMKLTYGDSTFWTSGDLYYADEHLLVEKYGDEIQADVVKMNHHGRETSTSKEFIAAQGAKVAVAMQGEFSSTIPFSWYRSNGAITLHTLFDGTVKVSTTGDGKYDVTCELLREQKKLYGTPAEDCHYVVE